MNRSTFASSCALLSRVMMGLVACSTTTPQSQSQSLAETVADSGTADSGTTDSGTTDAGTACEAGQIQCSGDTPQTCGDNGLWVSGTACGGSEPDCVNGTCSQCVPGKMRCTGKVPDGGEVGDASDVGDGVKTCESTGTWAPPWACVTGLCVEGSCTGTTADDSSPSCAPGGPGMTTCPAGTGSESCCTSIDVAGGKYYRTYSFGVNNGGLTDEKDPATISGFRLDKYLVTVGRFRQFASAVLPPDGGAGWLPAEHSGIHTHLNGGRGLVSAGATSSDGGVAYEDGWWEGWNTTEHIDPTTTELQCDRTSATWTDTPGSYENLPINCVTWYEAYAFCIWDGGFLPSDAELEYAAAGGSLQNSSPWGSNRDITENQYAIIGSLYQGNPTFLAPVGTASLGAGRWGQLDLAGEVTEWDLDWFVLPYFDPCTDCSIVSMPTSQTCGGTCERAVRGVSFGGFVPEPFTIARSNVSAPHRYANDGFRCARTP